MNVSHMIGRFGAIALAVMTFCASAEESKAVAADKPKTIKVVGLEDDKDNATVAAPASLGAKPQTVATPTFSADAIMEKAKDAGSQVETKPNTANVKSLTLEGMVIPPSCEQVKTLEEAVRNILMQANKQCATVSSNGIEKLTMAYQQLGDGKNYQVEWRKALRILLSPVKYNFTEDEDLVLFGLTEEVDVKHRQLAQDRLVSNRTPILFTTNESVGGMELRNAIREVAVKAGVTITTDYMEPADLYVPTQATAVEGKVTADEIGKANTKAAVQQVTVKRTSFDTNGQQIEWRTVLKAILGPNGYDFIEEEGVVKIAKPEKIKQWRDAAVAAKPLTAKVIRLYHADPEAVVERLKGIKGLLQHPNASLLASRKKDDNTDTVKNLNARIQTSSGQQSGMSDTTSQIFNKMVRPRTVPAIVAYDVEENMPNIEAKIKLFDIKEKQVLIEAIIFQLDNDNGQGDMDGVQWEGFEKFVPLMGSINNPAYINAVANTWEALQDTDPKSATGFKALRGRHAWMTTAGIDFKSTIQLIRKQNNAELLSNPMLVIGDHCEAAIQVSDVMPIFQVEMNITANTTTTENYSYQWNMLRSGTLMWVSPEITEDGKFVRLTVHPQVVDRLPTVIQGKIKGEVVSENYELKMHEMDTRATVPSGATLMFGGLISNEESEEETKVRWLGDIPLIGWLFRSKTKTIVQKNLVIMIRPTILDDDDQTGFETNALKETEKLMENSGRNMRKLPNGPYSVKEIRQEVKDVVDERVVKPFEGWNEPLEEKEDAEPAKPVDAESSPRQEAKPTDK